MNPWKHRGEKSYLKYIVEIANFLGTTSGYLLNGDIVKLDDLTENEMELIMNYRMINKKKRNCIIDIVRKFSTLEKNYTAQSARLFCTMNDGKAAQF